MATGDPSADSGNGLGGALGRNTHIRHKRLERPEPQVIGPPPAHLVEQPGIDTGPDHRGRPQAYSALWCWAFVWAPFGLSDADELRASISEGGFHDVSVRAVEGTVRFPSARHFVEYQVAGSPLAGPVGGATDGARAALVGDVEAAMRPYQTNQGLAFPIAAHLATAHA